MGRRGSNVCEIEWVGVGNRLFLWFDFAVVMVVAVGRVVFGKIYIAKEAATLTDLSFHVFKYFFNEIFHCRRVQLRGLSPGTV